MWVRWPVRSLLNRISTMTRDWRLPPSSTRFEFDLKSSNNTDIRERERKMFWALWVSFQLASGAFAHIKDTVLSALNREPTMDISPETVGTLSQIMLSQAQEVFVLKATAGTSVFIFLHFFFAYSWHNINCPWFRLTDKMKDAIVAKLANQASDYYGDAFKQCQYKENLPKVCAAAITHDRHISGWSGPLGVTTDS